MRVPAAIGGRRVADARPISGGDIHDAYALELDDGTRAFLKTRAGAAPGEYATEAAGLAWLRDGGALTPEVLEAGDDFLALEWLEREDADDEELGRRLARMHLAGAERFGALPPGAATDELRIGPLAFRCDDGASWMEFYAERLCRPLARRVGIDVELDAEVPDEPPARLHGDLWSGNVFGPYLIDPAAYGGHREVDLAMLELFGGRRRRLLAAYTEVAPLAPGFEDRVALWQLFPLLVHAVLFGGSYVGSARAVADRYR